MGSATRLTRKSVHTTAWSFAGVGSSLISGILTARMLGPNDRGVLAIVLTVAGIGTLVCALGTNVALRIHLPKDSRVTLRVYRRLSAKLALLCLVLLVPLILLLAGPVDSRLRHPSMLVAFAILTLGFFFSNQILDCFNALHLAASAARLDALGSFCTAVLVALCWMAGLGLVAALAAYALGFGLRALVGAIVLSRCTAADATAAAPGGERLLLAHGLPLLGVNVGQAVMMRIDQVIVGVLLGSHAAGLYAVAATPAGVLTVVSNSIGQVTLAEAAHDQLRRKMLVRQVLLAVVTTATAAAAGVIAVPWLIPIIFGEAFSPSVPVAQLQLVSQVLLAPFLVLVRATAGYAMVRAAGGIGLLGTVLILSTTLILVPRLGLMGASLACGITYGVLTLVVTGALAIRRPWRTTSTAAALV